MECALLPLVLLATALGDSAIVQIESQAIAPTKVAILHRVLTVPMVNVFARLSQLKKLHAFAQMDNQEDAEMTSAIVHQEDGLHGAVVMENAILKVQLQVVV
jgi:hypothetical protein